MENQMYQTREICGHQVNLILSKDGIIVRSACVMVGDASHPGMRAKDGQNAKNQRRQIKRLVADALGIDRKLVRASSRYSCLSVGSDGMIERKDDSGRVIGTYVPC